MRLIFLGFAFAFVLESVLSKGLDVFPYMVHALKELEDREVAEKSAIKPRVQYATSVCYDELGCFDRNGTFKHLKQLPDTPENIATQFLLYTTKNKDDDQAELVDYRKPESVIKSSIMRDKPLKVITHGFGGKDHGQWMWDMKDAFIKQEGANVIVVDWSNGAAVPHYINSAVNAELVGAQIAALYYLIKDNFGIPEKDLHVIGFSLGAQVMGFVGKRMKKMRGTIPGRITGLDPAGPLYEDYGEDVHVFRNDGEHVDIIHTNADLLIYGGVGIGKAIGHVDFYPNGGIRQPGCNTTIRGMWQDIMSKGRDRQRMCNHERAVELFIETINPPTSCQFRTYKCDDYNNFQSGSCFLCEGEDCGIMGYKGTGKGTHYLKTHPKSPFCAESIVITVKYPEENKKTYGAIHIALVDEKGTEQRINVTREKDERILPGTERVFADVLDPDMVGVKEVRITYHKYNGWFAKGAPTFTVGDVAIKDERMKSLFISCGAYELTDDVSFALPLTTNESC